MTRRFLSLALMFIITSLSFSQTGINPMSVSGIKGYWTFDDSADISNASYGTDLVPTGYIRSVDGPSASNLAVRLGTNSFFRCFHNIPPNGTGTPIKVNNYSLLIDFKINQFGLWRSFFQTDTANTITDDAEVFISPSGTIGVSATGYSQQVLKTGEWYRLVISVKLGTSFNYYLDGQLLFSGTSQAIDGRFSLSPSTLQNNFLLFADNDAEDNIFDIAQVAVYDRNLTPVEIDSLGGYNHIMSSSHKGINTYLQTPTPTSVYISWHSSQTTNTSVQYGASPLLGLTALGSYETIDVKKWHTVKLNGLTPDTHYYYRCISGSDTSQVYEFRTPFEQNTSGKHLRFVLLADSQSDINMPAHVSNAIEDKLKDLYGEFWIDSVSLLIRPGDMVGDGSNPDAFEKEYFNPFANLTRSIPSMISIGNHEGESAYYYQYVKYEDVSDYSYPNALTERYYSFKLANSRFIALNTNTNYQNNTEVLWLHNKLEQSNADPSTDFVFTFNHHPGHSEMWPDGNTSFTQNDIHGELANYPKVVFNAYGHSHNYEHGVKKSAHNQPQDFHVLCVGGAGAYLDRWEEYANQTDYPEIQSMYDHYSYVIFDVDVDNKSYTATTYSLGHPQKYLNNLPLESWHYFANQVQPQKPLTLAPINISSVSPTLIASPFNGIDEIMSSQFQISNTPGVWTNLLIDSIRDYTNVYGNSGAPDYLPIDLNIGIDLKRLNVPAGKLAVGNIYAWRIRYRDKNIKWSEWSDPAVFTVVPNLIDSADFTADVTSGISPLTVHFTDLSTNYPSGWEWDFDNNGVTESYEQDPIFTFNSPGLYSVKLITFYGAPFQSTIKNNYINILTTGINFPIIPNVQFYPNPFSDKVTFSIPVECGKNQVSVIIYDSRGIMLENINETLSESDNIITWDAGQLRAAVYFAHVCWGENSQVLKLIKIP
ncbi:MAG: fibronectin type III domain-containing protein [Bacteroidales bacterium]|nr:fibronectin type III domain-containing protein [Bacteroidales bacterium]